jgi:myo-inositol-1(or 4)-monophosphatase
MDNQQRRMEIEKILQSAQGLLLEGWSPLPGSHQNQRASKLNTENKSSFKDLVTLYDKKVEAFLLEKMHSSFKGENFIGEESSGTHTLNDISKLDSCWVIDPIDGTTNYARAYPFFCSTVAWLEKTNQSWTVMVGAVFDPTRNEMFSAARGFGATLNSETMKVTTNGNPQQALFSTGFASKRSQELVSAFKLFEEITKESLGVRRDGSAAMDLAYVAAGRTDAYWEYGLAPWDTAAGALLVEEAGGKVTLHNGQVWDPLLGEILSSNSHIYGWIQKKINSRFQ